MEAAGEAIRSLPRGGNGAGSSRIASSWPTSGSGSEQWAIWAYHLRLMDCSRHESPAGDDLLRNAVASLLRMGARAAESEPLLRVCGESHRGFESHPIRCEPPSEGLRVASGVGSKEVASAGVHRNRPRNVSAAPIVHKLRRWHQVRWPNGDLRLQGCHPGEADLG
jgi:hypothetical protein